MNNNMTAAQARMARAALKLTVREFAALAGISHNTVVRIEADLPTNASTRFAIRAAFEKAGIEFIDDSGVKLMKREKRLKPGK
jgi:transcriptional regulator with XRE-family HTH domain